MKYLLYTIAACIAIINALADHVGAQVAVDYSFVPASGNWNLDANWHDAVNNIDAVPDGTQFDERAIISNGGLAFVQTTNPPAAGALLIQNGTAEIRSGATLNTVVSLNKLFDGSVTLNAAGPAANLTVLPGGTLNTAGILSSRANVANSITFGGTGAGIATVNVPAASFQGSTRVYPNVAFTSTGSVVFGATSAYRAEINGTSAAKLNVGQNAVLGGTLNASFTGATPAVNSTWNLIEADSFVNSFATVTTTLTLPANQRLLTRVVPAAGSRLQLQLQLSELLVLNVNRDSGVISITHPGSAPIGLDSYSIVSSQGRMVTGGWNSLTEQNAFSGGWNEAASGIDTISELRQSGDGTATGGANVSLGAIYNPLAGTFAAEVSDLSFQYSDSNGRIIDGIVNYTGTKLNNLLLQVDPATGKAKLRNTSNTTVDIDGYVVSSTSSLTPAGWNSLDDQNAAGGDWLEFLNPSTAQLGEVKTLAATSLAPNALYDLGAIFNVAGARDLTFEFKLFGEDVATLGAVVYEAIGNADFDADGDVDGRDFLRWQRGYGITMGATLGQGDANGDGAVNGADLTFWQSQYGQTSSLVATVTAVPEPASSTVLILLFVGQMLMPNFIRSGGRP